MADEELRCPRCKRKIYDRIKDSTYSLYGDEKTLICVTCGLTEIMESTGKSPMNGNDLQFGHPKFDPEREKYWSGESSKDPEHKAGE